MDEFYSNQINTKPKNKRNKTLIITFIIIAATSIIGVAVYYLFNYQFNFKIIDIHDQIKTEKVKYGESAIVNNNVIITEKNNSNNYVAINSLNWKMNVDRNLYIKDTLMYLNISQPISLNIYSNVILLEKGFHGIYDSNSNKLIVIEGQIKYNNIVINSNNYLDLSLNIKKPFDRNIFINDEKYKALYEIAKKNNILSSEILDLTTPTIENLSISDGQETYDEQIEISGKTEKNSKIFINDENMPQNIDGTFKITKPLKNGDNIFIIKIIDNSNNIYSKKITLIKKDLCQVNTECGKCNNPACDIKPSSNSTNSSNQIGFSICNSGFNSEFLSLINTYRQENGKNTLSLNEALNIAACKHSNWMKTNNTLSHVGENGSQFYERCAFENISCDAENIAQGADSAQAFFDMWKNSSGHNENMLGDHTQIGVGLSGDYATTLFY